MNLDGRSVANFVLDVCEREGRQVSNLALQKIVYFCHVHALLRFKEPLVKHSFEAWEYGPVLPYLYREFKEFDRSPIRGRAKRINLENGRIEVAGYQFSEEVTAFLLEVVSFYSRVNPGDLVRMSHARGGPWHTVWNHAGVSNPGMKIANEQITNFYSRVRTPFAVM